MAISRWDPFGEALRVQRELDRVFGVPVFPAAGGSLMPAMDVRRAGDDIVVSAELPGVKPEDMDVSVTDGVLAIKGSRDETTSEESQGFVVRERRSGSFSRSIMLPQGVDASTIRADYSDGLLEVTVPGAAAIENPTTVRVGVSAPASEPASMEPAAAPAVPPAAAAPDVAAAPPAAPAGPPAAASSGAPYAPAPAPATTFGQRTMPGTPAAAPAPATVPAPPAWTAPAPPTPPAPGSVETPVPGAAPAPIPPVAEEAPSAQPPTTPWTVPAPGAPGETGVAPVVPASGAPAPAAPAAPDTAVFPSTLPGSDLGGLPPAQRKPYEPGT